MKPIEYYLDEILKDRNKDRDKLVSERRNLNPDIVLRELFETFPDRYEDFYEIMRILEEDKFIKNLNTDPSAYMIDKYRDCLITIRGTLFIESGGYTGRIARDKALNDRQDTLTKTLKNLQVLIAFGTIGVALIEVVRMALDYHWFSFCH